MSQISFIEANPIDKLIKIKILHETCDILVQEPGLLEDFYFIMSECSTTEDLESYIIKKLNETDESQISQYFWMLTSYLENMLKGYNDGQIKADTAQLKGKMVELYIFRFFAKRYDCKECQVNMRHHVKIDNWQSVKEVDVLGWDYSITNGEFYECKFSLSSTETKEINSQLSNLWYIKHQIKMAFGTNCSVGFATFQDSKSARDYLNIISETSDFYDILGRDCFM
ncbi:MAG: hypothetical protein K9L17_08970 [Clostridiales bacterium]|nr:hypothetical protein [Clostridiales bacterium]MCF8022808.1 hypothetical protein [Clostridiales bacterium]